MLRLYSLGFVDNVFLGMRPWTRASAEHMIEQAGARIEDADTGAATDEAQGIYDALMHELSDDTQGPCGAHKGNSRVESVYSVVRGISGTRCATASISARLSLTTTAGLTRTASTTTRRQRLCHGRPVCTLCARGV